MIVAVRPAGAGVSPLTIAFGIVLFVLGLLIVFTGLNRALGGLPTLGWQGSTSFFDITDPRSFMIQDSHNRFLGGLWTGIGLLMLAAPFRLEALRTTLYVAFALIFLGGLARFSSLDPAFVFGPDIVLSLVIELALMPVLALWLWRLR